MIFSSIRSTINRWLDAVDEYTADELLIKPANRSWSFGEVCVHLLSETSFFFEQAKICLSNNDNAAKKASANGKAMLLANSFPDELIEGPETNALVKPPEDSHSLTKGFHQLLQELELLEELAKTSSNRGKTKHPGLQYFDAAEWIQFADMHLRHHFRQKQRIDDYLLRLRPSAL